MEEGAARQIPRGNASCKKAAKGTIEWAAAPPLPTSLALLIDYNLQKYIHNYKPMVSAVATAL